ncbi:type I restriction enzyme M protein [Amycolatopsis pretoriensis]|uniref:Type I restriction enzyme M protein n=1 Tax=Amycolatopsis pretoriensis TaxID=218821 RepID=A0A1H5QVR4_9PSEU|nr:type I restriction-modification system subunit M/S [Amycolatopsis pretoriensis]SEF30195.1 type I restriction enzyme M protein [Amycolatopsis pretoriensis]
MTAADATDDRLVSRAQIAVLAGVQRPAVTNWQQRHPDFPQPDRSEGGEYFRAGQVIAWLGSRQIRESALLADESPGATYGERMRRRLAEPEQKTARPPSRAVEPSGGQSADRLLGPLANRTRGSASAGDYFDLIFSLVLLRSTGADSWNELARFATADRSPEDVRRLLFTVGNLADEQLRRMGLTPGLRSSVAVIRPESPRDLAEVVALTGEVGPVAFRKLLRAYETAAVMRSDTVFTPQSLTRLMARLVAGVGKRPLRVLDPYARGGELLAAVSETTTASSLRGMGPDRAMLRIAGINLALHGVVAKLERFSSMPWETFDPVEGKADVIVCNPPFNGSSARLDPDKPTWSFGPVPAGNDNFAWVQHVVQALAPGGRAVVLMPGNAAVSANQRERDIRRKLVEEGAVESVVALPARMFPTTPIQASIWVLKSPDGNRGPVLFVDARRLGHRVEKSYVFADSDIDDIAGELVSWRDSGCRAGRRSALSASVEASEIAEPEYSLSPAEYARMADTAEGTEDHLEILVRTTAETERLRAQAEDSDAAVAEFSGSISRVGRIRKERQARLNELCEINPGPAQNLLKKFEQSIAQAVPVVLPKHLTDRRIVMAADERKVSDQAAAELGRFRLRVHDIVCVRTGSTGPSALVEEHQEGWVAGTNLLRLHKFKTDVVDPLYLLAYLSLPAVVTWIQERSREATAVPTLSKSALSQLKVSLPSLDEQIQIGSWLRTADEQVAAHRELAKAVVHRRAAMVPCLMGGLFDGK